MINTWSVDDFLKQYSSINTLQVYRSTFREYFRFTYSELQNLPLLTLDRRITVYSVQYFDENRDYRNDLLKYKKHISHKAPKTITTKIACLIRYFEDNYIKFTKSFTRNLYGRGSAETVSEEYVPNNNDIARIIEYMPIQAKTVTLVLASSGMRIGEALLLELDDIEIDKDPARIHIKASITKTKKKRFTFISTEAKEILKEWLDYRDARTRWMLTHKMICQKITRYSSVIMLLSQLGLNVHTNKLQDSYRSKKRNCEINDI